MLATAHLNAYDRANAIPVHQGDCVVTGAGQTSLSTVLGSCVSACVRDRVAKVGGMNHFLLAAQSSSARERHGESARYGAFAMEQLINRVLGQGTGNKANLDFKMFGGGHIHARMSDIGAANIAFVRGFLSAEGYSLLGEDLGGTYARKVVFHPASGRAFVKRLDSAQSAALAAGELAHARRPAPAPDAPDIELF